MKTKTTIRLLGTALLGLPAVAMAQADDSSVERTRLETCAAVSDDIARLACFDAILSSTDPATQADLDQRAEDTFGLQDAPRNSTQARIEEIADDLVISSQVSSFSSTGRSNVLTLANGQVWRTNESGNLRHRFRGDEEVEIQKGRIGGYRLSVIGKKGHIGVVRIR